MEGNMRRFKIIVDKHIDKKRFSDFESLSLAHLPDGKTEINCILKDQAELFLVISIIRDMNLKLILIENIDEIVEEKR
jgi:hypothetical protein